MLPHAMGLCAQTAGMLLHAMGLCLTWGQCLVLRLALALLLPAGATAGR